MIAPRKRTRRIHRSRSGAGLFLLLLIVASAAIPASAQETGPVDTRDWGINFTPYALFASQATDVGGDQIRQSFGDISGITDAGFQLRTTGYYRKFMATVDWTWARLKTGLEAGPATVDAEVVQWIVDLSAGYVFFDDREPGARVGNTLALKAGARYWLNDLNINVGLDLGNGASPPIEIPIAEKQEWWDPMLTLVGSFMVTDGVGFGLKAAGGGLGIGNASRYVYDLEGLAHFRIRDWIWVSTGYRQFSYDRTDGEGDQATDTRVLVTGPMIGVSIPLSW